MRSRPRRASAPVCWSSVIPWSRSSATARRRARRPSGVSATCPNRRSTARLASPPSRSFPIGPSSTSRARFSAHSERAYLPSSTTSAAWPSRCGATRRAVWYRLKTSRRSRPPRRSSPRPAGADLGRSCSGPPRALPGDSVRRRGRFADPIRRQLDLFLEEQADLVDECDRAIARYDAADRSDAEELYGDYVDLVESATEILADMRDRNAAALADEAAEAYEA